VEKSGNTLKIHIHQMHPDYGIDPEDLLIDFGGQTVLGWAYDDAVGWAQAPRGGPSELERDTGRTYDSLFGVGADELGEIVKVVHSDLVRSAYNDGNRAQRLAEAGLPADQELTPDVVRQICGVAEIELQFTNPAWLESAPVGTEWEY
jgi:hypothetical protein